MSDELAKQLRDAVGMQVGALPVLIHKAADRIEALEARAAEAAAERDALREALKPFAEQAKDPAVTSAEAKGKDFIHAIFRVGDLHRAARAAPAEIDRLDREEARDD